MRRLLRVQAGKVTTIKSENNAFGSSRDGKHPRIIASLLAGLLYRQDSMTEGPKPFND